MDEYKFVNPSAPPTYVKAYSIPPAYPDQIKFQPPTLPQNWGDKGAEGKQKLAAQMTAWITTIILVHTAGNTPIKSKSSQPKTNQHQLAPINQSQDNPNTGETEYNGGQCGRGRGHDRGSRGHGNGGNSNNRYDHQDQGAGHGQGQ